VDGEAVRELSTFDLMVQGQYQPTEWAIAFAVLCRLSPASRALVFSLCDPGVSLRSTPGFTLSPAPQAGLDFIVDNFFCEAM
jgi:hypothetical protein